MDVTASTPTLRGWSLTRLPARAMGELARRPLLLGAVMAAAVAVALALLWTHVLGAPGSRAVDDLGQVAADTAAAGACLAAARRSTGRLGTGWGLFAAAGGALAATQLAVTGLDFGLGQDDRVLAATWALEIVVVVAGFVGVVFILFPTQRGAALLRVGLDSVLITSSLAYVSVALIVDRLVATESLGRPEIAVFVAFTAGDVALCSIALIGLSRATAAMRPTAAALGAAFLVVAIGDGVQAAGNLYHSGSPLDTLYLAGMMLVVFAAMRFRGGESAPAAGEEAGWSLAIPYAPPLLALVTAGVSIALRFPNPPVLRLIAVVTVASAVAGLVVHRLDLVRLLRRSKAAEAALVRNQQMLDRLLDTAPASLFSCDVNGKVLFVRGHPIGFTSGGRSLEGRRVQDLLAEQPGAVGMFELAAGGENGGTRLSADERELELICTPVFGEDGQVETVTGIVVDVTAASRLQQEIAANEAKSQLLATVSHELRTPLNSILGFAHLVESEKAGPLTARQRRYIGHVQTSGRHLLRLINEILDFSRLEAGGDLDVEIADVDANDVVSAAVDEVRPLAGERSLRTSFPAHPVRTSADPVRVEQILLNLLANAVQSTDTDGHIVVESRAAGPSVEISVVDDGVGIADSDHERIFSRYQQTSRRDRRNSGTGLGLPVSRHLAERMNGSLTVQSAPGRGSTFTLRLPAA